MKKLMALIILCFIPLVNAWEWNTHQRLAENTYYSLPFEIQSNLNVTLVKEGSIAPDKVFHDNRLHNYPPSYKLALKWINLTKESYSNKDYNNASYSFGVLTHYIADSFSSPHNIQKEDSNLHSQFESQLKKYIPKSKCNSNIVSLEQELILATNSKNDWEPWLLSKDPLIPQEEVEKAQSLLYSVTMNIFNASCLQGSTRIETFSLSSSTIFIGILILISIFVLFINLLKD